MTKPDREEARLHAGIERIERLGLSGQAASVAALERALAEDPMLDLAVAARLGEIPSPESAAALRRIDSSAGHDKSLRRQVRRSLYRLAQRGVAGAAAPEPAPEAARPLFVEPEPEGYLSVIDALGDRLLWILKPKSGGGLLQLSAVVNEPGGLQEAALAEAGRKAFRALRRDLETRHGLRLVEVGWRYTDWIAAEGYERAKSRGEVGEAAAAYPRLRLQLFRTPPQHEPSPIEAVLDPASAGAPAAARSAELFEEEEFRYWFLPEAVLSPHLDRYKQMRESPIVLDRFQQLSRVNELIHSATEEIFGGENASAWRRRLEETAYYFWKTDRPDRARQACAAARALAESASGGKGIPFFEELARRSFALFFEREAQREREAEASSVIVTPDQIRTERARTGQAPPRLRPGSGE